MERQQGTQVQTTIDRLEKYKKYEATILLSGLETFAHNILIREKLMQAGFSNVIVAGSGSVRTATGVWSRETQPIAGKIPSQVSDIKVL